MFLVCFSISFIYISYTEIYILLKSFSDSRIMATAAWDKSGKEKMEKREKGNNFS